MNKQDTKDPWQLLEEANEWSVSILKIYVFRLEFIYFQILSY